MNTATTQLTLRRNGRKERFSITMHLPYAVQNAWLRTFRYQEREHTAANHRLHVLISTIPHRIVLTTTFVTCVVVQWLEIALRGHDVHYLYVGWVYRNPLMLIKNT